MSPASKLKKKKKKNAENNDFLKFQYLKNWFLLFLSHKLVFLIKLDSDKVPKYFLFFPKFE